MAHSSYQPYVSPQVLPVGVALPRAVGRMFIGRASRGAGAGPGILTPLAAAMLLAQLAAAPGLLAQLAAASGLLAQLAAAPGLLAQLLAQLAAGPGLLAQLAAAPGLLAQLVCRCAAHIATSLLIVYKLYSINYFLTPANVLFCLFISKKKFKII